MGDSDTRTILADLPVYIHDVLIGTAQKLNCPTSSLRERETQFNCPTSLEEVRASPSSVGPEGGVTLQPVQNGC
jgi:hypothetical protein